MDPILSPFSLAAMVFLSLPLPLYASAVIPTRPAAARGMRRWVWGHAAINAAAAAAIIATPLPAWISLSIGAAAFLFCGVRLIAAGTREIA